MTLLVVGTDSRTAGDFTSAYAFADAIRIVKVDFVQGEASVLTMPRDLWVTIPGMEVYGVRENRLKTAYTYGNQYEDLGGGPTLLARTLAENFDIYANHYLIFDFNAFVQAVDMMGGVDVLIPDNTADFQAGWQHLDGKEALRFARSRPDNSSDIERMDRQSLLLEAVQHKMRQPSALKYLPELTRIMQNAALTDLKPEEIQSLVCLWDHIQETDLKVYKVDETMFTSVIDEYGHERLIPDTARIKLLAASFVGGQ